MKFPKLIEDLMDHFLLELVKVNEVIGFRVGNFGYKENGCIVLIPEDNGTFNIKGRYSDNLDNITTFEDFVHFDHWLWSNYYKNRGYEIPTLAEEMVKLGILKKEVKEVVIYS